MKNPNIPPTEKHRLETLRATNLLDSPEEERFNRITRMARRLLGVPIALVSLVDENRQWFKSCLGLDFTETPRDISFCGHTILGNEVFIIPDTLNDERFADNPLVLGAPNIRFDAGCPLSATNGEKLGTLCIIDQQPRELSHDDIEAFKDLAAMVEIELSSIQEAARDYLTGVLNRRGFAMVAQHSLHICIRQELPASLVFFDLDKFKLINDNFGHLAGDSALIAFVDQMESVYRDSDVIGRLGGDEFVCLLANTSKQQAKNVVAKLNQSLEKYNQKADVEYNIHFSYGIIEYDMNKHESLEAMLADADSLMYTFKKEKRKAILS